ncbi:MAG: dihydrofolate reductase [Pseudoxanthomonas sp.]
MHVSLIAALDRNGAIGKDNDLPWRLPDDLKRFKALTLGKPILMGRKTAQSLGRALPGRTNLVLSRSTDVPFDGMRVVGTVEAALEISRQQGAEELCVIGGGQIYALTLAQADRLYLTHVDTVVAGAEAFFPTVDSMRWKAVRREKHLADDKHACSFEFVDYVRRQ